MRRRSTSTLRTCRFALLGAILLPLAAQADLYISIVQGLGGTNEYELAFKDQREQIEIASQTLTDKDKVAVFAGDAATRAALLAHFDTLNSSMSADDRAAIYLIGHGSFDGFDYKFNLPGPDITGAELKTILEDLPGQNHFLLNTSSTSGAMLEAITGETVADSGQQQTAPTTGSNVILISATRNGNERNSTHFGRFFAQALSNKSADLNKNNNISIQEAFDFADHGVTTYFEEAGRLATEHPQLRGNGAAQFTLSRLDSLQQRDRELAQTDSRIEQLLESRQQLDIEIESLQLRRTELGNAAYLRQLQTLVLKQAEISEQLDTLRNATATP